MAPVKTVNFQTANFPIFCTRIIVIFCTTCIAREVFSLVIMRNQTHILPVLHFLKRGIAFVSSYYYYYSAAGIVYTHKVRCYFFGFYVRQLC